MVVTVNHLKVTTEVQLIYDFCKWQNWKVIDKIGPLSVTFSDPVKHETHIAAGFIEFVMLAAQFGLLQC